MQTWIDQAKLLPCGQRRKVDCACGHRTLLISHDRKGYRAHCFHDQHDLSEWEPHGQQSLAELRARSLEWASISSTTISLEGSFPTAEQGLWLSKYGIHSGLWKYYSVRYSEHTDRILLPVMKPNESFTGYSTKVACVVARAVQGQKPKYLMKGTPRLWYGAAALTPSKKSVVVTEDILSSMKINLIRASCSSLSANLTEQFVLELMRWFEHVIIWYDDDKGGLKGQREARKTCDLLGMPMSTIWTPKDPKAYDKDTITSILHAHEMGNNPVTYHEGAERRY